VTRVVWSPLCPVAVLFVACAAQPASAQEDASVLRAQAFKSSGGSSSVVYVWFDQAFGTTDSVSKAESPRNYAIVDLVEHKFIAVKQAAVAVPDYPGETRQQSNARKIDATVVELQLDSAIADPGAPRYSLLVQNLTFDKATLKSQTIPLTFSSSTATPEAATKWISGQANDRDDADLYFAGEAGRTADDPFVGGVDVKIRVPYFRPKWWKRLHTISPEFDLQVNSDPEADPDSLKLGVNWSWFPLQQRAGPLSAIRWSNIGGIESDGGLDTINGLWASQVVVLPLALTGDSASFHFNPLLGIELGGNISRPESVPATADTGVFRSDVGALLALSVGGGKAFDLIEWTTEYHHRKLYVNEFDSQGVLVGRAHDWLDSKIEFKVTKYFGLLVGFQNGRQPPAYSQVDKRWRFGLTFKSKFARM
jgi:hypothetical protein